MPRLETLSDSQGSPTESRPSASTTAATSAAPQAGSKVYYLPPLIAPAFPSSNSSSSASLMMGETGQMLPVPLKSASASSLKAFDSHQLRSHHTNIVSDSDKSDDDDDDDIITGKSRHPKTNSGSRSAKATKPNASNYGNSGDFHRHVNEHVVAAASARAHSNHRSDKTRHGVTASGNSTPSLDDEDDDEHTTLVTDTAMDKPTTATSSSHHRSLKHPRSDVMNIARAATFTDAWPFKSTGPGSRKFKHLIPMEMAKAGWSHRPATTPTRGSPDNVICTLCGLELDGWEVTDSPETEHKKRHPNCLFFTVPDPEPDVSDVDEESESIADARDDLDDDDVDMRSVSGRDESDAVSAATGNERRKPRLAAKTAATSIKAAYAALKPGSVSGTETTKSKSTAQRVAASARKDRVPQTGRNPAAPKRSQKPNTRNTMKSVQVDLHDNEDDDDGMDDGVSSIGSVTDSVQSRSTRRHRGGNGNGGMDLHVQIPMTVPMTAPRPSRSRNMGVTDGMPYIAMPPATTAGSKRKVRDIMVLAGSDDDDDGDVVDGRRGDRYDRHHRGGGAAKTVKKGSAGGRMPSPVAVTGRRDKRTVPSVSVQDDDTDTNGDDSSVDGGGGHAVLELPMEASTPSIRSTWKQRGYHAAPTTGSEISHVPVTTRSRRRQETALGSTATGDHVDVVVSNNNNKSHRHGMATVLLPSPESDVTLLTGFVNRRGDSSQHVSKHMHQSLTTDERSGRHSHHRMQENGARRHGMNSRLDVASDNDDRDDYSEQTNDEDIDDNDGDDVDDDDEAFDHLLPHRRSQLMQLVRDCMDKPITVFLSSVRELGIDWGAESYRSQKEALTRAAMTERRLDQQQKKQIDKRIREHRESMTLLRKETMQGIGCDDRDDSGDDGDQSDSSTLTGRRGVRGGKSGIATIMIPA